MSSRGKIRDAGGEIVIVVLGILIAFGLDAAWDDRTDRSRGRELLRSIEVELVENRIELERHLALKQRHRAAASVLLRQISENDGAVGPDSLKALLSTVRGWSTYEPRLGALETVTTSEQLQLIQDRALQVELASFPALLIDLRETEQVVVAWVQREILPLAPENSLYAEKLLPDAYSFDPNRFLETPGLPHVLAVRADLERQSLREAEDVLEVMDRINGMIEAELRGSAS